MKDHHPKTLLTQAVHQAVDRYFSKVDDYELADLHGLVTGEVEKILLCYVWDYTKGNKSRMSRILGLSRVTLTRKLEKIEDFLSDQYKN